MKRLAILLVAGCLTLSACGTNRETAGMIEDKKPTLDVVIKVEGNSAKVSVLTDLHISKEHYGGARKAGEGHIHTYLNDGEKVAMDEPEKTFPGLAPGKHEIKVSLHNNDHTPYDVTKTVAFEVK
ncbi:hypothetical protein [Paenibacillus sp. MBLB4367]|uniref:hypothetical protein n=1 Tax=Paenibacillus sp. MBLB4367 TaxID=3384767 RepID=UPI0039083239